MFKVDVSTGVRYACAFVSLIGGLILGFLALYIPPCGNIHETVLILIAQLLVFAGSCLGVDVFIDEKIRKLTTNRNE